MTTCSVTLSTEITEGTTTKICDRVFAVDDNTVTEYVDDVTIVAPVTTNQAISLAALSGTAKYILVIFSGACSFKLQDTSSTAVVVGASGGSISIANGSVTALYVTNPGSVAITVKRVAAA